MPVIHIRDTLITSAERKSEKYRRIWSQVVKFIEKNESRVKVELEVIDGEDFKTWRWISLNTSSPSASSLLLHSPDNSWTSTTVNASSVGDANRIDGMAGQGV